MCGHTPDILQAKVERGGGGRERREMMGEEVWEVEEGRGKGGGREGEEGRVRVGGRGGESKSRTEGERNLETCRDRERDIETEGVCVCVRVCM